MIENGESALLPSNYKNTKMAVCSASAIGSSENASRLSSPSRRSFAKYLAGASILWRWPLLRGLRIAHPEGGSQPYLLRDGQVNILKANLANYSASLAESDPKGMWIQGWNDAAQIFSWKVLTPKRGEYGADILVSGTPGCAINIQGPQNQLTVEIPNSNDHWGNNWNKLAIPGWLSLPEGVSTVTVSSSNPAAVNTNKNYHGAALLSIELIERKSKAAIDRRVKSFRSDTKWLADAGYGLMFQCGEWSYPPHGEGKPWQQLVEDFDVDKFAEMAKGTGVGYVIWSATWRTYYFPAPIKAIDAILPGRTSNRDLIADMANALEQRGIRLMLYYHCGYGDKEWSVRNFGTSDPNLIGIDRRFRSNWLKIMTEVGHRYGSQLAGWLIDEGWYPSDFEEQGVALKAGNPNRIVAYNDWVRPRLTEFQDFQFGESFTGLNDGAGRLFPNGPAIGSNGIYQEGPHKGLQSHGMFVFDATQDGPDWGIWKPNTKITKPLYTQEQIITMTKNAKARKVALSFNLLMYEDGTISSDSLEGVRLAGKTIRGDSRI